jgi:hypothetical protein
MQAEITLRQAAQQALKSMDDHMYRADTHEFYEAKEALRAALAEPERKPLSEDEIETINRDLPLLHMQARTGSVAVVFARAIEAAHGIGEKK